MKILSAVEDFKEKVFLRRDLVDQKKALSKRIRNGCEFFEQINSRTPRDDIMQACSLMRKYTAESNDIDKQIFELDIAIGTRLESEFLDSIIKIRTKQVRNEAGDIIPSGNFFFMPDGYNDKDYMVIDENDVWFLKFVKAVFSVQNVEITQRGDICE